LKMEKILSRLAQALSQKSYEELTQQTLSKEKLQQILEEINQQEQKHLQTINEIISKRKEEKK